MRLLLFHTPCPFVLFRYGVSKKGCELDYSMVCRLVMLMTVSGYRMVLTWLTAVSLLVVARRVRAHVLLLHLMLLVVCLMLIGRVLVILSTSYIPLI